MSGEVVIRGANQVVARLRKVAVTIERNKDRAARSGATMLARAIRHEAPVDKVASAKRGGKSLRRSVRVRKVPEGYRVGPSRQLGHLVIKGTAPHEEFPTTQTVMAFPAAGGTVFTTSVNHPGAKKNPFVQRALTLATRAEALEATKVALRGGAEVTDTE